ncbi:hypothetical protein ACP70R_007068 [Stipagrostis hirtigluma subsp. patula]
MAEIFPRPRAQWLRFNSPRSANIPFLSSCSSRHPTLTLRDSKILASLPFLAVAVPDPSPPPSSDLAARGGGRGSNMVVTYTQEHVYRHPWHRVTAAAWRKFTDPAARGAGLSHILDVHTLSRDVDPRSGRLRAVRAIAGRAPPLPFLLRRLLVAAAGAGAGDGEAVVLCVERSDVDAPARDMRVVSRNANLRGLVHVEERCSYAPHPERPDEWTLFRQETSIRCAPLAAVAARVAEAVERRCAERFVDNAVKGREVVERICDELQELDSPPRPR